MSEQNDKGLRRIRRALLSVSDKTGLVEFARALSGFDVELLSTGGTARALREAGLQVRDVADVTGFPEMLDGRVKTLHPRIHGGLLAVRANAAHMSALNEHQIEPIDLVVINLYPFVQTIAREGVALAEAIEQIDIGGPAMIRSAAKNHNDVTVVVSAGDYQEVINELSMYEGATSLRLRRELALRAFQLTAIYDVAISAYLAQSTRATSPPETAHDVASAGTGGIGGFAGGGGSCYNSFSIFEMSGGSYRVTSPPVLPSIESAQRPPDFAQWTLRKTHDLRYGENPHQVAALYATNAQRGFGMAEILAGKEMSYNNYVDADAAWQLVCDFDETACAIIKHTNPAGVGLGASVEEAYRRALATDPVSAFG